LELIYLGISLGDVLSKLPKESIVLLLHYDERHGQVICGVVGSPLPYVPTPPPAPPPLSEEQKSQLLQQQVEEQEKIEEPTKKKNKKTIPQSSSSRGGLPLSPVKSITSLNASPISSLPNSGPNPVPVEPSRPALPPATLPINHVFVVTHVYRTAVSETEIRRLCREYAEWSSARSALFTIIHDQVINNENADYAGVNTNTNALNDSLHMSDFHQRSISGIPPQVIRREKINFQKVKQLRRAFVSLVDKMETLFGGIVAKGLSGLLDYRYPRPVIISADLLFHALPLESLKAFHPRIVLTRGGLESSPLDGALSALSSPLQSTQGLSSEKLPVVNNLPPLSPSPIRCICRDFSLYLLFHRLVLWERSKGISPKSNSASLTSPTSTSSAFTSIPRKQFVIVADPHDEDMPSIVHFKSPYVYSPVSSSGYGFFFFFFDWYFFVVNLIDALVKRVVLQEKKAFHNYMRLLIQPHMISFH
jgi:hypothetical protein